MTIREKDKGIPTDNGGRYAEGKKGQPTSTTLTTDGDEFVIPLPSNLDPDLIASIPPTPDGKTYAEHWNAYFDPIVTDSSDLETMAAFERDELGDINYGRHRGGPYIELFRNGGYYNDEEDLVERPDPSDPRWDDKDWQVILSVYTRNGGGNRECWCGGDEHDETCLIPAISAMQEHPKYIDDLDSEDDYTYASFLFAVEDVERAKRVCRDESIVHLRQSRHAMLNRIASGTTSPLEILPPNSETAAALQEAKNESSAAYREISEAKIPYALGYQTSAYFLNRKIKEVGEKKVADLINGLQTTGPLTPEQEETIGAIWDTRSGISFKKDREKYLEANAEYENLEKVNAAIGDENTPEVIREYLTGQKFTRDLDLAKRKRDRTEAPVKDARAYLRKALAYHRKSARLEAKIAALEPAVKWPGSPATMPDALKPVKERDPFD